MTHDPAPLSDDDLSADLDDEAGIDVRARLIDDPRAAARQAELASAARWLRGAPAVDLADDQIDALVAGALEALDTPESPRGSRRAAGPWLVAAAVVALMAVGLTMIWSGRENDADTAAAPTTTVAADVQSDSDTAEERLTSPESESAAPSTTSSDSPYLGTFADAEGLRGALASSLAADATTESPIAAPSAATVARCEQQLQISLELNGEPRASGYAVVDDRLVLVYEWDHESFVDGRPTTLVTAVGGDACDEVALFER
jgi:hypothetical protein